MLGTTGVGKSSGVAIILQQDSRRRGRTCASSWSIRTTNTAAASATRRRCSTPRNLRLPFWLFNFEETIDAFFGGRPGVEEEVEILSEVIPLAKAAYLQYSGNANDRPLAKKTRSAKMPASPSTRRCPTASRI